MAKWTQEPVWLTGEQKKTAYVNEIINYVMDFYCVIRYGGIQGFTFDSL
jgi:hypothetical protein